MPAPPRLGPVGTVVALVGGVVAYRYGERHQSPKHGASPLRWGIGGMAVGGEIGIAIDYPIRRIGNSIAMLTRSCVDTAGFIRMAGRDTLSVESVMFTTNAIAGVQAFRDHGSRYSAVLTRDLAVYREDLWKWSAGHRMSGPPTGRAHYLIQSDTAFLFDAKGPPQRATISPRWALLLDGMVGPDELLTRRVRRMRQLPFGIPTLYLANGGYAPIAHPFWVGIDSLQIHFGNDDTVADLRVDQAGRILTARYRPYDGEPVMIRRIPCGEAESLIKKWTK